MNAGISHNCNSKIRMINICSNLSTFAIYICQVNLEDLFHVNILLESEIYPWGNVSLFIIVIIKLFSEFICIPSTTYKPITYVFLPPSPSRSPSLPLFLCNTECDPLPYIVLSTTSMSTVLLFFTPFRKTEIWYWRPICVLGSPLRCSKQLLQSTFDNPNCPLSLTFWKFP